MGAGRAVTLSSRLGSIMGQQGPGVTGMMDSLQEQTRNIGAPPLDLNDPASIQARAQWLAERGRTEEALAMKNQAHSAMMQAEQQRNLAEAAAARSAELQPINTNPLKSEVAAHNEKQEAWKALHKAGMGQYGGAVASGEMTPEEAYNKIEMQRRNDRNEGRQDAAEARAAAKGPTLTSEQKAVAEAQRLSQIDPALTAKIAKTLNDPNWADNPHTAKLGSSLYAAAIKAGAAGGDAEIPNPTTPDKEAVSNTLFGTGANRITVSNGLFNDVELDDPDVQDAYRIAAEQAVAHIRTKYGINSTTAAKDIQDMMAKWGEAIDTAGWGGSIDPAKLYEDVVEAAAAKYGSGGGGTEEQSKRLSEIARRRAELEAKQRGGK